MFASSNRSSTYMRHGMFMVPLLVVMLGPLVVVWSVSIRSLTYIMNNMGDSIEPCFTPCGNWCGFDL